jgi:hypothetical protein
MAISALHVLKKDDNYGTWVKVDTSQCKYSPIYDYVMRILLFNYKQSGGGGTVLGPLTYSHGTITINIETVERHRCCAVLYCTQYDKDTNGLRFLAYGIKYNEDSDYGIGTTLDCITIKEALSKCRNPATNMAMLL